MPCHPPTAEYRTWILDSQRWAAWRPRHGDIVIATYPKSGTTWMQQIVASLVFLEPGPLPVMEIAPWIDRRFPEPIETVSNRIEAQTHRRLLKAHLPADGLPLCDEVRCIHVARDGRETALSFHNHGRSFTPEMLAALDRSGLADPRVARPYPRMPEAPADHFHRWLTQGAVPGHADGLTSMSWFHTEASWWAERHRPNVLLVHYADLKADLRGAMDGVADFLGIDVPPVLWPDLVAAASFETMRERGETLLGRTARIFADGASSFFHRGETERWRGLFRDGDLALYEAKLAALPDDLVAWLRHGRSAIPQGPEAPPLRRAS